MNGRRDAQPLSTMNMVAYTYPTVRVQRELETPVQHTMLSR
jgi:hypothetical protein